MELGYTEAMNGLRRGFSIVEMMFVVAVASLLIVGVTVLIGRFFTVSRTQFELTRTTEDARIHLGRMTEAIRNARTVQCASGGTTTSAVDKLDLVFVIDTTSSMQDDINAVKAAAVNIIDKIHASASDARIGIVTYRDYDLDLTDGIDDYPSRVDLPLTSSKSTANTAIQGLTLGWGGDEPESVYCGLASAVGPPLLSNVPGAINTGLCAFETRHNELGGWRVDTRKAVILMGDARPHDPEPNTSFTMASISKQGASPDSVHIFSIGIGTKADAQSSFQSIAAQNGGSYFSAATAADVVAAVMGAVTVASAPDPAAEWWLREATSDRIVFYTNVDDDPEVERVTYERVGNDLQRTVEHEQTGTTPCVFDPATPNVVAKSLQNAATQPVFEYVAADGSTLPAPIELDKVVRVRMELVIDTDDRNLDNAASLVTEVTPRVKQKLAAAAAPPPPPPPPPSPPSSPVLGECQSTGDTVDGKVVMQGDGGCVYENSPVNNIVWRAAVPQPAWPNSFDFNWPFATSVCDNLTDGGRSDWRLPTTDEVEALSWPKNMLPGIAAGLAIADNYLWITADMDYPIWTSTESPSNHSWAEVAFLRSGNHYAQSKVYTGISWGAFPSSILCVAPRNTAASLSRYPTLCSARFSAGEARNQCDEDQPYLFGTNL